MKKSDLKDLFILFLALVSLLLYIGSPIVIIIWGNTISRICLATFIAALGIIEAIRKIIGEDSK